MFSPTQWFRGGPSLREQPANWQSTTLSKARWLHLRRYLSGQCTQPFPCRNPDNAVLLCTVRFSAFANQYGQVRSHSELVSKRSESDGAPLCSPGVPTCSVALSLALLHGNLRFVEAIDVCNKVLAQYPDYPKIREEILCKAQESLRP